MATSHWLFLFSSLLFITFSSPCIAQSNFYGKPLHVETKPTYTPWKENYKLTKITYYKERIVIDLAFEFDQQKNQWTESVAFMPPDNLNAWCLKNVKGDQIFPLVEIRDIKRNGKYIKRLIKYPQDKVLIKLNHNTRAKEVFTCSVHFKRLPSSIKQVDLLEGKDSKYGTGHWNFFKINVKQLHGNYEQQEQLNQHTTAKDSAKQQLLLETPKRPALSSIYDLECNKVVELNRITFQDNSTKFQNLIEAERALAILKEYLKKNPQSSIILYGHTDIFGSTSRNMELSQQRVKKLYDWFLKQRINASRLQMIALGDTQPIYPEGNPQNRRVEVKISCSE